MGRRKSLVPPVGLHSLDGKGGREKGEEGRRRVRSFMPLISSFIHIYTLAFKRKRGKKGGAEDSEGKGTTRKGFTDFFQRNVASTLASVTANAKQTGSAMKGSSLNKNRRVSSLSSLQWYW